jgi:protein-S-isoprenylcysteine O-methyltransferase Ste14
MKRGLFLLYGLISYGLFFLVFAYLFLFVGNLPLAPKTIDSGTPRPLGLAVAINLMLIVLFGVQHSVMARPAFKRWWTKFVPQPIERSTYLLASSIVTIALMVFWQPITIVLWDVPAGLGRVALWGLFVAGWLLVPLASLMINHSDLFGMRQVWLYWRGQEITPLQFRTPWLYAWVRHPLYIGWAIAFWATPTMTVGHLLFAVGLTTYMLIAVQFEERDLVAHFGEQYANYQKRVGMFLPKWSRSKPPGENVAAHHS